MNGITYRRFRVKTSQLHLLEYSGETKMTKRSSYFSVLDIDKLHFILF